MRLYLYADRPARAVVPFALVAVAGLVTMLLPPHSPDRAPMWMVSVGIAATLVVAGTLTLAPPSSRLVTIPPQLFFLVIFIARDATGGSTSGLAPLVLLPVLWVVLYGTRGQLWAAAVATATVFFLPLVLVGAPTYALGDWRRGTLWFLAVAVVCPVLQRAVERLRHSEMQHRLLAGQLSSILRAATEHSVIATDLAGTITVFSEGAERMLGYTAAELVGRSSPAPLHDPDEVSARATELGIDPGFGVFVHDIPSDGAASSDWTYLRQDGTSLRVRLTITRILDDGGAHTGWIGIARDITVEEAATRDLEVAEARWRLLLDHLPDTSVFVVGPNLEYRVAVGAGLERQGMSDVQGRTLAETSNEADVALLEPIYRAGLSGEVGTVELLSSRNSEVHEVTVVPLPPHGGDAEALVVARDVSQARRQAAEARRSHDQFEMLFEEAPHGALFLDAAGLIVKANPAYREMMHLEPDGLVGQSIMDLPFVQTSEPSRLADLLTGRTSRVTTERELRPVGSPALHVSVTAVALSDGDEVRGILATVVDISERKRFEVQLAHLADHDPLTGLANRRRFDKELAAHLDRCRRYGTTGALIMLDLDNFKQVNDTLGHGAGDQLIVSTAELLTARLRISDVVARLGGDEFAILLPGADRAAAELVADDIVGLIRDQVCFLDGTRPRVTTSVGVVLIDDPTMTASELVSTADMTMYDAKDSGRDRYVLHGI